MTGVGADVVALQEVTARTLPLWRAALVDAGFAACEATLDEPPATDRRRLLGVLVAARGPLERLAPPADAPWPERVLCCRLGDVEIVNLHSPIAPAPELAKVRTHEAIAAYLTTRPPGPRVLCGDLNTPRRELPDGDVLTFAHDSAGRLRPGAGRALGPRRARAGARPARSSTAGSTPSARCTATRGGTRAGRSPMTAAAGAWTTCSRTACGRARASTRTSGAAAASATTRRSSWTSNALSGPSRDRRPGRACGGADRQGRRPAGMPLAFQVVEDAAWR